MVATTVPGAPRRSRTSIGHGSRRPGCSGWPDARDAVAQVSCGQAARSLSAIVVDPSTCEELPDGSVGEIWRTATISAAATGASPTRRSSCSAPDSPRDWRPTAGRKPCTAVGAVVADHRSRHVRRRPALRDRPDRRHADDRRCQPLPQEIGRRPPTHRPLCAAVTLRHSPPGWPRHRRGTRPDRPFRSAIGIRRHFGR